ncbi:hypothetical protein [Nitrosomonas sp. ANs5]|uniref:hypothetical protein n=1 Tax=Nitrosomonas sp. ANs5 TaxID=3423941 RepID=UPI003D35207B
MNQAVSLQHYPGFSDSLHSRMDARVGWAVRKRTLRRRWQQKLFIFLQHLLDLGEDLN